MSVRTPCLNCTDEPTIPKVYSDNYSDIREVPTHIGIRSETPLCCYNDDWSFKSKEELEKLGYDEEGGKLPTEQEKAEAKAKEEKLEKLQRNLRQLERKIRRNQNYVRVNLRPVAKSLAQNSYDKTKTFTQQRLDIAPAVRHTRRPKIFPQINATLSGSTS